MFNADIPQHPVATTDKSFSALGLTPEIVSTVGKIGFEHPTPIQAAIIPGNPAASNSQYSQVQGVRGSVGGGWGFNVPTPDLAAAFETGDPRREATIIFRGETTPQGDANVEQQRKDRYMQAVNMYNYMVSMMQQGQPGVKDPILSVLEEAATIKDNRAKHF